MLFIHGSAYTLMENVGTGEVCVNKIGRTTKTLRVSLTGGNTSSQSNQRLLCVHVMCSHYVQYRSHRPLLPHTALQAELGTDIYEVLTFASTETKKKRVQFPIADDNIALETDETLMFRLVLTENVTDVLMGPFDMTTIIIQDDDSKTYSFINKHAVSHISV